MADKDQDAVDIMGETLECLLRAPPSNDPQEVAESFKQHVRKLFGGERITVRKCVQQAADRAETRARVRAEYNGRNINEITARYNISRRTVYNYLK